MARKRFTPGKFVRIPLADGSYGYGRLRKNYDASFYDLHTEEPISDLDEIASKPILFTVGVHKSVLTEWEVIGTRPLEEQMKQPVWRFWQDIGDFRNCFILDMEGNKRTATPEECEGLERWSVWEPNGIERRLLDTFMGRPNPHVEHSKVRYEDHPNVKRKPSES
ncbi:MAG: immunity 26/phosphotriesterase HocA family protein [Ardenticatenaceae bacterium]|nr:immunity 26/phosphotriesterase HocA family protein [Ardenticatenaceae bacterium]